MNQQETIKKTIENLLEHLSITYSSIDFDEHTQTWVTIQTNDSALLIGRGGDTIRAFNHLVQKIVSKSLNQEINLTVDVNGYKKKEKDRIIQKATLLGDRAKNFKVNIKLEPMSAYERLIIHEYFSADPLISTESSGEGYDRCVVLKYIEPLSSEETIL